MISVYRSSLETGEKRELRAARGLPDVACQTLPGLPRAARPSGRFAEGKTPQIADMKHFGRNVRQDVAWPAARSAALWAFCRRSQRETTRGPDIIHRDKRHAGLTVL